MSYVIVKHLLDVSALSINQQLVKSFLIQVTIVNHVSLHFFYSYEALHCSSLLLYQISSHWHCIKMYLLFIHFFFAVKMLMHWRNFLVSTLLAGLLSVFYYYYPSLAIWHVMCFKLKIGAYKLNRILMELIIGVIYLLEKSTSVNDHGTWCTIPLLRYSWNKSYGVYFCEKFTPSSQKIVKIVTSY